MNGKNGNNLVNEIEELEEEEKFYYSTSDLFEIDHGGEVEGSLFSFDFNNKGEHDIVYVVVGNNSSANTNKISLESSIDALFWTLKHGVINPNSAIVFLIHIFPQTKLIPTPCKLSLSHTHKDAQEIVSYMPLTLTELQHKWIGFPRIIILQEKCPNLLLIMV